MPSSIPTSLAAFPDESDTPVNKTETTLENKISNIDKTKEHIENPSELVESSKAAISNKLCTNFQSSLKELRGLLDTTMCETITPTDDLGIVLENNLSVIDTEEEHDEHPPELIRIPKLLSLRK